MRTVESPAANRLKLAFCAAVIALAIFQFSENTVDPDLWGHVTFGRHMLDTGTIPKADFYSWTANGQPWVNHEWLAEIVLAKAHQLAGGSGLLLLKMVMGLAAFGVCLRLGARQLDGPARAFAWAFAALAVVEISFGFAARPQIFTALFLTLELSLLQQIHRGRVRWAYGLPVLFLAWINCHGGALAGMGLLGLTAGMTTLQWFFNRAKAVPTRVIAGLWLAVVASTAALFCNPWKAELLRWLIGSILWLRPEISEWNATPFNADHAAFFAVLLVTAFSWIGTRRPRAWWELAACTAFALLGWRAERNAPLFCLVALALVPPHLASALGRFRDRFTNLEDLFRSQHSKAVATAILVAITIGTGIATFTLHKEHPLTMEAPRSQYPVAAMDFLTFPHGGKVLTFFDWGEMVIFEAPGYQVSIDGRLDTSYSRELIAAHWKFYNGEPFDEKVLPIDQADFALLPAHLAGTAALAHRPGWTIVYADSLAIVLVRDLERFPKLKSLKLPVIGLDSATQGREPFPDHSTDRDFAGRSPTFAEITTAANTPNPPHTTQ